MRELIVTIAKLLSSKSMKHMTGISHRIEHREDLAAAFLQAAQKGLVRQGTVRAARESRPPPRSDSDTRRHLSRPHIGPSAVALRYQTYLKMLIHEALEREEKASC